MSSQPDAINRVVFERATPRPPFGMNGTGDVKAGVTEMPGPNFRDVARLQFLSVDESEMEAGAAADDAARLKDQVTSLEERVEETRRAGHKQVEEARLLARLLARKEWEEELERRLEDNRSSVRRICEEFDRERTRYFAAVEGQVVKLALAIAGRVLHREAKMDPLLLSAAVRVALDKVKNESETRLRVPVAEVSAWRAAFETGLGDEADNDRGKTLGAVQVVGDVDMPPGECLIETSVGTVELGIEAQLLEIEEGFFDLLKKRPA